MKITFGQLKVFIKEARLGPINGSPARVDAVSADDAIDEIVGMLPPDIVVDEQLSDEEIVPLSAQQVIITYGASRLNSMNRRETFLKDVFNSLVEDIEELLVDELGYQKRNFITYMRSNSTTVDLSRLIIKKKPFLRLRIRDQM